MSTKSEQLNELSAEVTALTSLWMRLVNVDSHKDRDCHWTIETVWSYGESPTFRVYHEGYVYKSVNIERPTMYDALYALRNELKNAIKSQEDWARRAVEEDNYMADTAARSVLEIILGVSNG